MTGAVEVVVFGGEAVGPVVAVPGAVVVTRPAPPRLGRRGGRSRRTVVVPALAPGPSHAGTSVPLLGHPAAGDRCAAMTGVALGSWSRLRSSAFSSSRLHGRLLFLNLGHGQRQVALHAGQGGPE